MDPIRGLSLAAVVLLSSVLPLAASGWLASAGGRTSYRRTVWVGQGIGAIGGLWCIFAPTHPVLGVAMAAIGCLACLPVLRRQMKPA
ncbi:hypothetical protein [Aquisphaera insulae]|uniref:hypothetical protein n=1 Tax=Aquisphaera insulae TaxID=2712864 RepID=UPI0013EBFC39|nr:hypothetical protein [Aquisphaera insulae]